MEKPRNFPRTRCVCEDPVKTVLTFGDKPAPAMAQIALRKTTEESKITHSKASEVITKKAYMDDICDSVDTVMEAKQQTGERWFQKAKIGMRALWQTGVDWDEETPPAIRYKWIELFKDDEGA